MRRTLFYIYIYLFTYIYICIYIYIDICNYMCSDIPRIPPVHVEYAPFFLHGSGLTVEVLSYDSVQLSWSLPTLNDCNSLNEAAI